MKAVDNNASVVKCKYLSCYLILLKYVINCKMRPTQISRVNIKTFSREDQSDNPLDTDGLGLTQATQPT